MLISSLAPLTHTRRAGCRCCASPSHHSVTKEALQTWNLTVPFVRAPVSVECFYWTRIAGNTYPFRAASNLLIGTTENYLDLKGLVRWVSAKSEKPNLSPKWCCSQWNSLGRTQKYSQVHAKRRFLFLNLCTYSHPFLDLQLSFA